nr:hypothetical protein [Campylobacter sp.]
MKTCLILYDRVNLLSFAQIYNLLKKSKIKFDIISFHPQTKDEYEYTINSDISNESLFGYEMIFLPDGLGALDLQYDDIFLSWIKTAKDAKIKVCVDLGSLILGGAGLLDGKKATVRGGYINTLKEYCEHFDGDFYAGDDIISILDTKDSWQKLADILNG